MKIGNFTIDDKSPVFIIAELSANHNGSIEVALETIKAAKELEQIVLNFKLTQQTLLQLIVLKMTF